MSNYYSLVVSCKTLRHYQFSTEGELTKEEIDGIINGDIDIYDYEIYDNELDEDNVQDCDGVCELHDEDGNILRTKNYDTW